MYTNEVNIQELLNELKTKEGFFIFEIGDFYVQFLRQKSNIYVEAFSDFPEYFEDKELATEKFNKLGYSILDGNYFKYYPISNSENILNEVKIIISDIYEVDLSKKANIVNEIHNSQQPQKLIGTEEFPTKKSNSFEKNGWKYVFIVIGILFFIYKFDGSSKRTDNANTESKYSSNSSTDYSTEYTSSSVTKNEAYVISKKIIQKEIVDIKINEFGSFYESQIKELGNNTFLIKNYCYIVSENGFSVRKEYLIELEYISGDWADRGNWNVINFQTQ